MRSAAPYCCSCVLSGLFLRTGFASESLPLPLPEKDFSALSLGLGVERVLLALVFIGIVIIGIRWVLKRGKRGLSSIGSRGASIEIIERKPLGPRQSLLLVRVQKKGVLLHQSKNMLTPLCEVILEEGDDQ